MATKKNKKKPVKVKSVKNKSVIKKSVKAKSRMMKPVKKVASTRAVLATPVKARVISAHIQPLEDRVIVRVAAVEEVTAGGLIIPGNATERPNRGEVVAAGPGRRGKKGKLRPLDVGVGDEVLFPEFAGTKITAEGAEFLILREDELLGIVT